MQLYLAARIQLFIRLKLMRRAKARRRRNLSRRSSSTVDGLCSAPTLVSQATPFNQSPLSRLKGVACETR